MCGHTEKRDYVENAVHQGVSSKQQNSVTKVMLGRINGSPNNTATNPRIASAPQFFAKV